MMGYEYPGTRVLRNKFDIQDARRLEKVERQFVANRLLELCEFDLSGPFNADYLSRIHGFIFQDVYDWAGEFRTVEIFKGGSSFSRPENIRDELDALGDRLLGCDFKGLPKRDLAKNLASVLADLNHIHPFREGNGRTQRVAISQMAFDAGYGLDWSVFDENIMRMASIMAGRGDLRKFELYLADGLKFCANKTGHDVSDLPDFSSSPRTISSEFGW